MKQGKLYVTLVMTALAAALAVYLGVYAFQAINAPYSTTVVYPYTVNDSTEADGLLVRDEYVLPDQAGIVEQVLAEGERVGVGQNVVMVYRDSQAQANQAALDALDLEIRLLDEAAIQAGDVQSAARLDEDILQSVVTLRAHTARGDYSNLEAEVLAIKSGVLKRGLTYGDGVTAAELSARLSALKAERADLAAWTSSAVTPVRAPRAGTYSSLVDGYETVLTPEAAFQLTPESLANLMERGSNRDPNSPGKLILGTRWYFVSAIPNQSAARLGERDTVLLRFTGDFTQDVEMLVEQIGMEQGSKTLVIFSSDRYLSRTTLLRRQTAELIFRDFTGLRIPKSALRLREVQAQEQEQDSSAEAPDRSAPETELGIFALVNGRVEFKGAEIVAEGGDYYVVRPTENGRKTLRAGDRIIIRGSGIFEGQLLEY